LPDLDEVFAAFQLAETIRIDAPTEEVWKLITDVHRMVEFSPELVAVDWLGEPAAPEPGARFAGRSRIGGFEWTRNCTIVEARVPKLFTYEVYDEADEAAQSRWSFEVTAEGEGTILRQRFSHAPAGRSTIRLMAEAEPDRAEEIVAERAEMLQEAMRRTLESMRDALTESRI
jgi:ligand-binding SRPBCC domain-containing protein